jgi:hypothetical protein
MKSTSVQGPKGKVKVNVDKDTTEEVAAKATEEDAPTTEEEVTMTNGNGNGSYGKRAVKLADMPTIELTKAAFGKLTPEELVATLIDSDDPTINRISRERAKAELVERIKASRIKIGALAIADLTYKNVVVKGVELPTAIRGVSEPKVTLTEDEFGKLKPEDVAAHVEKYAHKRRVANVIIPDYILAGMPMTAEDVVSITNGRVAIKGVVVQKAGNAQAHAVTTGVQFD